MEKVLPELLEIIFSYLHPKDIKNAAKVCQSWREIIASSTPLMQRLISNGNPDYDYDDIIQELPILPYVNFSLGHYSDRFEKGMDCNRIQKLHFQSCDTKTIEFLMKCQSVTTLVVNKLYGNIDANLKVDLPNLAHLDSSLPLLPHIQSHKVKFLSLSYDFESENQQWSKELGEFLMTCGELKHLIFKSFCCNQICRLNNQLESLEILDCGKIFTRFKPMFESQQASLKYLNLDVDAIDDDVSDFIYHEMSLEKLIDGRMRRGKINKPKAVKIKNLTVNCVREDFKFFQKLLPYCHDLNVLSINLPEDKELDMLNLISQLPKLKCLKVRNFFYEIFLPQLKFPEVKELVLPDNCFINVICSCPKLQRLQIEDIPSLNGFKEIFKCCPDIEMIDLRTIFHLTDEMLEALKFAESKSKLKYRVTNVEDFEKLVKLKNRLIINYNDNSWKTEKEPFALEPNMLTELYGNIIDYASPIENWFDSDSLNDSPSDSDDS